MSLCETLAVLSKSTWLRLGDGRSLSFQTKEETITDILLLELKKRHPLEIKIQEFSRRQEASTGADWEWWLCGNDGRWIGFRIQAKVLNYQTDCFDHLHYRGATAANYQCEILIDNALNKPIPMIPLYCLYLQTNQITDLGNWSCQSFVADHSLYGCSFTSAFSVRNFRAIGEQRLSGISHTIRPWHCLVCCKGYRDSDSIVSSVEGYVGANFDLDGTFEGLEQPNIPDTFSSDAPPPYVDAIVRNEFNSNTQPPDKNLAGVVVYQEKLVNKEYRL